MTTTHLIAAAAAFALTGTVHADVIRLADGSILEGQLAEPSDVTIKTSEGDRKVSFALLPADLQKIYWPKAAETRAAAEARALAEAKVLAGPLADEELASLANEVNLEVWAQVSGIGSFRDKAEKRGPGGLVVTKAFNALDENWVSVYSPKDPVGQAGHWNEQTARAKAMSERTQQFMQKRWLELFIKAGNAVARRDSTDFAVTLRDLKRSHGSLTSRLGTDEAPKMVTAK